MQMSRRGFLKTCLALAAAPAVVRAESLMKLWVPPQELIVPPQELASAQFSGLQIETEHGCRYVASAWVNSGTQWVRKSVSGIVSGAPVMEINANGEIALVGAKECVEITSVMGDKFSPKDYGLHGGMVLSGDAKYSAQGIDVYSGGLGTSAQDRPSASRLVRNLISTYHAEEARTNLLTGTADFGTEWSC